MICRTGSRGVHSSHRSVAPSSARGSRRALSWRAPRPHFGARIPLGAWTSGGDGQAADGRASALCFRSQEDLSTFLTGLQEDYAAYAGGLWEGGVRSAAQLANAKGAHLEQIGVCVPIHADDIKARAAAVLTASSLAPLYSNVVLHTPVEITGGYFALRMRRATRAQLAAKLALKGCSLVAEVQEAPAQLLRLGSLPPGVEVWDIEGVELRDGVQLAAVLDVALASFELSKELRRVQEQAGEVSAWQRGVTAADEAKCAEWAVEYLRARGDQGVLRFCHKELKGHVPRMKAAKVSIEVDGLAASASGALLVERKPRISVEYVEELADKLQVLRELAEASAPNSAMLRDPSSGRVKDIQAVLMADGWPSGSAATRECMQRMVQLGILPALPRGDTHAVGDGCHPWPPVGHGDG